MSSREALVHRIDIGVFFIHTIYLRPFHICYKWHSQLHQSDTVITFSHTHTGHLSFNITFHSFRHVFERDEKSHVARAVDLTVHEEQSLWWVYIVMIFLEHHHTATITMDISSSSVQWVGKTLQWWMEAAENITFLYVKAYWTVSLVLVSLICTTLTV